MNLNPCSIMCSEAKGGNRRTRECSYNSDGFVKAHLLFYSIKYKESVS